MCLRLSDCHPTAAPLVVPVCCAIDQSASASRLVSPCLVIACFVHVLSGEQVKPRYIAMAFDVGRETTFRRQLFPEYKAHRKPVPIDLALQVWNAVGWGGMR